MAARDMSAARTPEILEGQCVQLPGADNVRRVVLEDVARVKERRPRPEPERGCAAAPAPRFCLRTESRPHRVLIDISGEGHEVGFVVDQLGEEASFEDVPYEPVSSIDAQCVALIQDPHADREIRLLSADEKVIVVRHQAVPIAAPAETKNDLRQVLEEPRPIKVVVCDRRPSDAP